MMTRDEIIKSIKRKRKSLKIHNKIKMKEKWIYVDRIERSNKHKIMLES